MSVTEKQPDGAVTSETPTAGRPHHPRGAAVPVLYIGGVGRSGSTLLERLLDQIPGYTAVGETHHLLQRGAIDDEMCGCNESFSKCSFWQEVGDLAFGGWDRVEIERMLGARNATDRTKLVPQLLWNSRVGTDLDRTSYVEFLTRLYRAIHEVSGESTIIDSSKNLSTACVLHNVRGLDLRIVQLVRDSRGVAYSWTKKVVRPEVSSGTALMPRYHPVMPASRWLTDNLGFSLLAAVGVPLMVVRYEDLLAAPRETLTAIHHFAGFEESPALDFLSGHEAVLSQPTHSVSGNPMRFDEGPTELRPDNAWTGAFPTRQAAAVTALTAPLLLRYGYLGPRAHKRVPTEAVNR